MTLSPTSIEAALPAGSRIPWQGSAWYLQGANVPWFNWACDFGCAAKGGVSSPDVSSAVGGKLAQAEGSGLHTIRWWTFEGDPWQITRDGSGAPDGINPAVYADFDEALRLANKYDLYYDFVLFSGPAALPATWLSDPNQQQKLAETLGQLFAHYKSEPRILSWEVFNEPENDIWNHGQAAAPVQALVGRIAASAHANSAALVTVGSMMLDGLPLWMGLGLDYYQAHWYDPMSSGNWCARCTDYPAVKARYNLDAPLVIGEMFAGPDVDAAQRLGDFYAKGYAGSWLWSLFADHTDDHLAVDLAAAYTFSRQHADIGPSASMTAAPLEPGSQIVSAPGFVLGFRALRDRVGQVMGNAVESEHGNANNCDTQQQTTTGLAYWRCATNTMTFAALPDGLHHWGLVSDRVVEWFGPNPDPPAN